MAKRARRPAMPRGGERYGAWYDAAAAEAACAFFPRYLRHTEGVWAGQRFELAAWQAEIVRTIFGWKRRDGTRLVRRASIWVPRKNGKTEFAAGLMLLVLVADGEMGGQVYSMAVDKDQAKIVFTKAGTMVGLSPELAEHLEVFKTSIFCPELMARFSPLSSTPASKQGFSPSAAVGDEVHEWPDGELHDIVHKGSAARSQPLEVLISTAGVRGRGYGWEVYEHARQVREGVIEDPSYLAVIYEADEADDWSDEATWRRANPGLGTIISLDYMRAECAEARRNPRKENEFKRYHLNIWTEQVSRWLPLADWDACTRDPDDAELWRALEAELAGRPCWGGLDLASTRDVTALAWDFPPEAAGGPVTTLWRFFLPGDGLAEREERDGVPWRRWAELGAVTLTEGNVTDYRFIKEQVFRDAERFEVEDVAIDRWNATQIAVELGEEGITVALFGQGFASMSAPSKELERLVMGHSLEHGNNPVARWMARNAAVATDPAGNIKPAKDKSGHRIDGIVAQIMARGRAMSREAAGGPSVYEERGLVVL